MAKKDEGNVKKIASYAFLAGVIIAVLFGLLPLMGIELNAGFTIALVVIGLIIGFVNVSGEESAPFLLSGAVLVIASSLGGSSLGDIKFLGDILGALLALFTPATIVVAVKNVFNLAKN